MYALKKHFCFFVSFVGLLFLLAGCQKTSYPVDYEQLSAEERLVIRFSHVVGEDTPKGLAARKFAKLMKERSNGYIEVQIFPNSILYKDGEEMEALSNNDIQMIAPATSKVTSTVPEWSVVDLPFAFYSYEEVHAYMQGKVGRQLIGKFEKQGLVMLGMWDNGFKQLTNREYPINMPADIKGLNMRIMPSDILEQQFELFGASAMKLDFNNVFQSLDNGLIDAQENTLSNIVSKSLHLKQGYMTVSNHGYLGYVLLMNKEFWDGLPENVQFLIQDTLSEVSEWQREIAHQLNEKDLSELEKCDCIQIHNLSEDERQQWEEAFSPVYDFYRGRFGAKYINSLPKIKGGNKE
ncbi:DctP family TRAP transporter solute-binding subunit [Sporosarcina aquimarina]|uniref:DctP family TRAP transporter solute-binding subunit n=1 Tax=Sporosarcina aquimarina TaxID=114975 RepID=UPI001C8DCA97|nr:DctP family TRAP transporter solute-binding subunit [Sporosarcina aquimarina]MBY0221496.1 DctP family TRAP transporter solute-binding subunit [Sporosarcina aquimarina]